MVGRSVIVHYNSYTETSDTECKFIVRLSVESKQIYFAAVLIVVNSKTL